MFLLFKIELECKEQIRLTHLLNSGLLPNTGLCPLMSLYALFLHKIGVQKKLDLKLFKIAFDAVVVVTVAVVVFGPLDHYMTFELVPYAVGLNFRLKILIRQQSLPSSGYPLSS